MKRIALRFTQGAHSVICSDDVASNGGSLAITSRTCRTTQKLSIFREPGFVRRHFGELRYCRKNIRGQMSLFLGFVLCTTWSARPRARRLLNG